MDGPKRTILGRTWPATAAIAVQLVVPAPLWAQAPAADSPPRASRTLPPPPAPRVDPNVQWAGLANGGYASSQQAEVAPPVPAKPQPSYPQSAPTQPYAPPAAPTYSAPAPQPYAPPAAPQYMLVPVAPQAAAPPAAAPGNFFLPNTASAPPQAPAYAAPTMMAPAYAAPTMMAPAYAMPMAPSPVGNAAAPVGSSVSVATAGSRTSVEVRGPGLLGAGLARFGERLTRLGRTRVRTVQETVLSTPQSQPLGGTATIATAGMAPVQLPASPASSPPQEAPPEMPTPSPQGGPAPKKHSMAKHFLGHQ